MFTASHDPCSIFVMTNETVNIWTHLIGFIIFSVLLMDDILLYLPENNAIWSDYAVFIVMDICFQVSVHNIIMPPDVVYWLYNRISLTSQSCEAFVPIYMKIWYCLGANNRQIIIPPMKACKDKFIIQLTSCLCVTIFPWSGKIFKV